MANGFATTMIGDLDADSLGLVLACLPPSSVFTFSLTCKRFYMNYKSTDMVKCGFVRACVRDGALELLRWAKASGLPATPGLSVRQAFSALSSPSNLFHIAAVNGRVEVFKYLEEEGGNGWIPRLENRMFQVQTLAASAGQLEVLL